ncbi:MAG TPA: 3-oxoacyl-[acyl-carrier-protein] synthase III C-terminal domain-containing protein, partial [Candidatus Obscuribacterales bacterium]
NTSAASIPLAFTDAIASGKVKPPATCCLVGFGGGLTWGSAIIRWTAVDQRLNPAPNVSVGAVQRAAQEGDVKS